MSGSDDGSGVSANGGSEAASATAEARSRWRRWAGDVSGAYADLGTVLPLMLGVVAVRQVDPAGILVGFGAFALAVAVIYQRPVPVQPMKAVAAITIAGGLDAAGIVATGLLVGVALAVLGGTGVAGRLAGVVPVPVLQGIRLGVALYLAWAGIGLIADTPVVGGVALIGVVALQRTPLRPIAAVAIVVAAGLWGYHRTSAALPALDLAFTFPDFALPESADLWISARTILLPQLALTMTNAVLITAAIAGELFPSERDRITSDRLALSSGLLNVALAPLGAFPMCHGAGGLVVQHRFGARTGLAPAIFGASCLAAGLLAGPGVMAFLSVLPLAAVGALLVIAGAELALGSTLPLARPGRLAMVVLTALVCVLVNVAAGLVVGLVAEWTRSWLRRRSPAS